MPPQPPHTSPPPWVLDHRPKSSFPSSQLHDDLLHHLGRVSGPMHYSPCSQCASVTRLRRFGSVKYISIRVDDSGFSVFPSTWFTPLQLFSIPFLLRQTFGIWGVDFLSCSSGVCFSLLGFFFCFSTFVSLFSSPNRAYRWQRWILRLVRRIYPMRLVAAVFVARRHFADEGRLGLHPCPPLWASIAYGTLDGYSN
jgi:hypothetical protein